MFNCGFCGKVSDQGEPATQAVVETREKIYQFFNRDGELVKETKGWEIVKQVQAHALCVAKGYAQVKWD